MATYYMTLMNVGPYPPGTVLAWDAVAQAAGVDIARLLAAGAIRTATGGEISTGPTTLVGAGPTTRALVLTSDGAPTSGTFAGLAPVGTLLLDLSTVPPTLYINTGTTASPTWTSAVAVPLAATVAGSSGVAVAQSVAPTVNQSGTAGYTGLDVNVTETTTGSGAKKPLRVRKGATELLSVDNAGNTVARAGIGFYATAAPAQATITGTMTAATLTQLTAVVKSLLTALAATGVIIDGTT